MNVKDCIAVVTGGASGWGGLCENPREKRGKAVIFDLQDERGANLAAELGANCLYTKTDVTNEESVKASIAKAAEAFGTINAAINCAGVGAAAKVLSKKGPYR